VKRRVDVDGCNNFRDLGGYPTANGASLRWRALFRADGLHHLTERGVATVRDELGIREIVDLRSSGEIDLDGRGPLAAEEVRFHHLPLFDGEISPEQRRQSDDISLGDRYAMMLRFASGPIARVIETLARVDAPAVFHCAAGKDRTGVLSAVILGALDVRDEVIVADYAATRGDDDLAAGARARGVRLDARLPARGGGGGRSGGAPRGPAADCLRRQNILWRRAAQVVSPAAGARRSARPLPGSTRP
jgi:hypothetical protein